MSLPSDTTVKIGFKWKTCVEMLTISGTHFSRPMVDIDHLNIDIKSKTIEIILEDEAHVFLVDVDETVLAKAANDMQAWIIVKLEECLERIGEEAIAKALN